MNRGSERERARGGGEHVVMRESLAVTKVIRDDEGEHIFNAGLI